MSCVVIRGTGDDDYFDFDDGNGPVPAHKHPNGGGWVADTATVDETAYVGAEAQVFCDAKVYGNAQVFYNARVNYGARVSDRFAAQ